MILHDENFNKHFMFKKLLPIMYGRDNIFSCHDDYYIVTKRENFTKCAILKK